MTPPSTDSTKSQSESLQHMGSPSFVDLPVVCVVGLGYIGLPTAAVLANCGMRVHGVEVNTKARNVINQGRAHIIEPDLDELVKKGIDSGRLEAFEAPSPADVFILCVPTPVGEESGADLSYVRAATESICRHLKAGDLVILESTSPPGTTEQIASIVQEQTGLTCEDVHFAHAPERVLPGKILHEVIHNDRVVGGINEASTKAAVTFYKRFVDGEILECHCRVAETVKLVENASRDSQIAFANELSMFCDAINTDVREVIRLANHHPRVNILQPGPGVGGHCIAVDPWFLIKQAENDLDMQLPFMRTARETNCNKTTWVLSKIDQLATESPKKRIACLGATYKPDVDDLRCSPAAKLMKELVGRYGERVLCCDPNVSSVDEIELVSLEEALQSAEIVVILVAHQQFHQISRQDIEDKTVLDFTHAISICD